MKNLVIMLGVLLISGCSGSISSDQVQKSIKICELNGGLAILKASTANIPDQFYSVTCKNGAVFYKPTINKIVL